MPTETVNWIGALLCGKRYEVTAKLGEGGMGVVYQARDLHLNSQVVIKVPRLAMLQDPDFAGRFAREVRSLVRLVHPHIVKVTDVGEFSDIPFAVMQYLPGGSLRDWQECDANGRAEPRPLGELRHWLAEIAAALDYIHGQHNIHRDVKPDNILFDGHGSVYLSDFGIAKVMADTPQQRNRTVMTNAGMVLGTAPYMAPEVLLGQPYDGHADQYALAVTVYQVVSGNVPFDGATPGAILMQLNNSAQPLHQRVAHLPKALSAAVQKGMHRDPAQRYADCATFAQTVLAVVLEKPLVGHAVTTRPPNRLAAAKDPSSPATPPHLNTPGRRSPSVANQSAICPCSASPATTFPGAMPASP